MLIKKSVRTIVWLRYFPNWRRNGSSCPYCAGRLASKENCLAVLVPDLAAEWDYDVNGSLLPEQVLPKSMRSVGWVCRHCGHRWNAPIAYRTEGSGCPACRKKQRKNRT
ncbi:MAG: zinc-ribbon domain-containing protein [Oscillibacter sp.]|nr:zinc-ribbon domain-containing protein [Oscillibacter sp.]MCI9481021.1 zinc-ribbon domain-containing protein [Oscillibacter sp.]